MMPSDDFAKVKAYGDSIDDGVVQLSFTLPVPLDDRSREGAKRLVQQMGFAQPVLAHASELGEGFSFYIVYARSIESIDLNKIVLNRSVENIMQKQEIDEFITCNIGRKIVVIGACIESDAHTVGIDAIMNMKGYNGHKGLESYHEIEAINLGAQVSAEDLVVKVRELKADAVLISQVVTQRNIHMTNLTRLADLFEAEGLRDKIILVVGGPYISNELAKELGYDAGFGKETYAEEVASFIVRELVTRRAGNGGNNDGSAD